MDRPVPVVEKSNGPFHTESMVMFQGHSLPEDIHFKGYGGSYIGLIDLLCAALSDAAVRRLLFGHDEVRLATVEALLPPIVVISAWRRNVEYMERRLDEYRHNAIASPSMDTFVPLTVIRRNIAHLQDAIIMARKNVTEASDFDKNLSGAEVDNLASQYDVLLQRVEDMSTLLNNEIQLVIGSVTVQVNDRFISGSSDD